MGKAKRSGMQVFVIAAMFGGMAAASAMEMPPRQPGLWKQTQYEGRDAQKTDVIYQCVDEASEKQFQAMAKQMAGGGKCTEESTKRKGSTLVGRSVCQIMGSKVTHDYVVSGNMKTEFRVESRSKYDPPLFGEALNESVILAEWQGPCKPGQKPGDMIVEGEDSTETVSMEDMGNLQEMSKALEQLQSSQGLGQMLEQIQKAQTQAGEAGVNMQEIGKMMEQMQQLQKQFQR